MNSTPFSNHYSKNQLILLSDYSLDLYRMTEAFSNGYLISVDTTHLPEMELNPTFTRKIIETVWEFSEAIDSYIYDTEEERRKRVNWAHQNSWNHRALDFENFCDSTLDTRKISIITLHYGSIEQTINCIRSIENNHENVNLIIVNNVLIYASYVDR